MAENKSSKLTGKKGKRVRKAVDHSEGSCQDIGSTDQSGYDLTASGSFYFTSLEATFLGRLLQALPIPALLTDSSRLITFVNRAAARFSSHFEKIKGQAFCTLFQNPEEAAVVHSLIGRVLSSRKPRIHEGLVEFEKGRIWGRLHFPAYPDGP